MNSNKDYRQYVQNTAELIDLQLSPEYLSGVVDNFASLAVIASLVTEFELPEEIEIAPTFQPWSNK